MKTRIVAIISLALVLTVGLAAVCQASEYRKMVRGKWWQDEATVKALELKPDEIKTLERLHLEVRSELIDVRAETSKAHLLLEYILEAEELDEAAARKVIKEIDVHFSRMGNKRFEYVLDVRKLLGAKRFRLFRQMFGDRILRGMPGKPGSSRGRPPAGDDKPAE